MRVIQIKTTILNKDFGIGKHKYIISNKDKKIDNGQE